VNVYWGEELVGKTRVLYNDVNPCVFFAHPPNRQPPTFCTDSPRARARAAPPRLSPLPRLPRGDPI
jgi:hypothetical protein